MPSARKTAKSDPVQDAAVDYFAARSHEAWRKRLLKTNPEQKGKPRMRLRGGVMVDVNQPWAKLDPKAKSDNKRAARDAFDAVKKFPADREAAAEYVHQCWIKRNKNDPSQPKALFKAYARLTEVEKDKDRAHVDRMKAALAAVRKKAPKKTPRKATRAKRAASTMTVEIDAASWRRLEAAAKQLSAALGREVPVDALVSAGVEAIAGICKAMAADVRGTRG
jgi:hypothetical protein